MEAVTILVIWVTGLDERLCRRRSRTDDRASNLPISNLQSLFLQGLELEIGDFPPYSNGVM